MPRRHTAATIALIAAAGALQAAPAWAVPRPFLDVRDRPAAPRVATGVRPLTRPAAGSPAAIATRFVRRGGGALRLGAAGAAALREVQRTEIPGDATLVAFRRYDGAIPSFDGGVRVLVARDGSVLGAIGAPDARSGPRRDHPAADRGRGDAAADGRRRRAPADDRRARAGRPAWRDRVRDGRVGGARRVRRPARLAARLSRRAVRRTTPRWSTRRPARCSTAPTA